MGVCYVQRCPFSSPSVQCASAEFPSAESSLQCPTDYAQSIPAKPNTQNRVLAAPNCRSAQLRERLTSEIIDNCSAPRLPACSARPQPQSFRAVLNQRIPRFPCNALFFPAVGNTWSAQPLHSCVESKPHKVHPTAPTVHTVVLSACWHNVLELCC